MLFLGLRYLGEWLAGRKKRRPIVTKHHSWRRRLEVELLPDRILTATITVTSPLDTVALDGAVTLREAIMSTDAGE